MELVTCIPSWEGAGTKPCERSFDKLRDLVRDKGTYKPLKVQAGNEGR